MNNHFLKTIALVASSAIFVSGCGDTSSFETPNTTSTPTNNNLIAQNNFTILFSDPTPKFFDPATGDFSSVTSDVSVQIGDNNNQLITGSNTIIFRTEWGLIDPSCVTVDGGCSVTWRSGSSDTMPADFLNTIVAYTSTGQESFGDINGNGLFDDGDLFGTDIYADVEEPYVNVDESGFTNSNNAVVDTFTPGDINIDTINGLDLTGANEEHDDGDTLFNGPNCSHSTLCSTIRTTVTVWESGTLWLNGGDTLSVGGTISGLTGTLNILDNLSNVLTTTTNGTYSYPIIAGTSYSITVTTTPAQTCTVTNASATPTTDVTNVDITCN